MFYVSLCEFAIKRTSIDVKFLPMQTISSCIAEQWGHYSVLTWSRSSVSFSQPLPGANSPAATTDTSTPRVRISWRRQAAKQSTAAWVAHWIPRTGDGTRFRPEVRKTTRPWARRTRGRKICVSRAEPETFENEDFRQHPWQSGAPLTQKVEVQALAKHGKWNPLEFTQSYPVGAVHHRPQSFGAVG